MRPHVDRSVLAPEDRFQQVATVLAVGLLRLHARPVAADSALHVAHKKPPNSSPNCLELPGETVLSVHTG